MDNIIKLFEQFSASSTSGASFAKFCFVAAALYFSSLSALKKKCLKFGFQIVFDFDCSSFEMHNCE